MNKIVILLILAIGVGVGAGYLLGIRTQDAGRRSSTIQTVVPGPSPKVVSDEKFENIKAEVKLADGKKFTYIQDGKEKTLTDLTGISVWKSPKPGDKPEKADWKDVKVGDKVQLASEKATGKIVAVLVL